VLNETEIFIDGETKLGQYQVAVVRYTPTGWVPSIPPLDALVTNYRLILQPQTRRPHPPASIPGAYITKIADVELNKRAAVQICLKTGHKLFFFTSWGQGLNLTDAIKAMLTSPVGNRFKHHPAQQDINRLIQFIQSL
jgi:hypothetical protein